jgi:hypothetical protein
MRPILVTELDAFFTHSVEKCKEELNSKCSKPKRNYEKVNLPSLTQENKYFNPQTETTALASAAKV